MNCVEVDVDVVEDQPCEVGAWFDVSTPATPQAKKTSVDALKSERLCVGVAGTAGAAIVMESSDAKGSFTDSTHQI